MVCRPTRLLLPPPDTKGLPSEEGRGSPSLGRRVPAWGMFSVAFCSIFLFSFLRVRSLFAALATGSPPAIHPVGTLDLGIGVIFYRGCLPRGPGLNGSDHRSWTQDYGVADGWAEPAAAPASPRCRRMPDRRSAGIGRPPTTHTPWVQRREPPLPILRPLTFLCKQRGSRRIPDSSPVPFTDHHG